MASLYDVIQINFSHYKYAILVLILIIIFGILGYVVYLQTKSPISSLPFGNVANTDQRGVPIQIYFFYVDWCPHCKTAKPEWDAFRSEYDGKTVNNQTIECVEHNCTDDENQEIRILMNDFKVTSFPHIVLVANGSHIEFDAKITKSSLEQFILTVTQ